MLTAWLFFISRLMASFQNQDLISFAENVLSKPSPTLVKINQEINKNIPETKKMEKSSTNQVLGKRANGKLGVIQGGTKFFIEFKDGGMLVMGTAEDGKTFPGTWTQSGNAITMKAGASTFSGTLDGDRISGKRTRRNAKTLEDTVDSWEVTLEK